MFAFAKSSYKLSNGDNTVFDFLQQQLNPIENRSAICKTLLAKEGCITKTTMISLVIQIRFHDKDIENICQKLIKPMSKQYGEIIKKQERTDLLKNNICCTVLAY